MVGAVTDLNHACVLRAACCVLCCNVHSCCAVLLQHPKLWELACREAMGKPHKDHGAVTKLLVCTYK